MRMRAMSPTGDYTLGAGQANFLVNSPETVAQLVQTRLLLWTGEWFLDTTEGTPWATQVLGVRTKTLYDQAVKRRILSTPGMVSITSYSSTLVGRSLAPINATLQTLYGEVAIKIGKITPPVPIPPTPPQPTGTFITNQSLTDGTDVIG